MAFLGRAPTLSADYSCWNRYFVGALLLVSRFDLPPLFVRPISAGLQRFSAIPSGNPIAPRPNRLKTSKFHLS